jgi:molybdopterin/thiamine biosynthesis adenylyltransferase
MGFWNEKTQQALLDTDVAIAGTGGAGYLFALELARIGVQRFQIADPETFDAPNANRVFGATANTVGQNKSVILRENLLTINSAVEVEIYPDGVSQGNISEFICDADIVLDATELSMPHLGTMIAREARRRVRNGIRSPVPVLNIEYIGHGGQVTVFHPDHGVDFEDFMGIKGGSAAPLSEVARQVLDPSRHLAYLPPYGDIRTLEAIQGGAPLPSNMLGVGVATQLGVAEVFKLVRSLRGDRHVKPTYAPKVRWYDAYTGRSGRTGHPRFSYYRHLAVIATNNALGRHDPGSYSRSERSARGDYDDPSISV